MIDEPVADEAALLGDSGPDSGPEVRGDDGRGDDCAMH